MEAADYSLELLGVVLMVGLFIPALLERFRVPFASSLILLGAVLGPHGLGYVRTDETLTLFAFLGATFQMLLAGFEAHELNLRLFDRDNAIVFALNGILPALVGGGLGVFFGYSWQGSLLTAAMFMSSSILLVFSFVRHFHLGAEKLGKQLKAAAVMQDLATTLAAFVILKSVTPHARFSLPILLGLVVALAAALRMFAPEVVAFAFSRFHQSGRAAIEQRVRFLLGTMLLVLFLFSALDVPAVVAAFLVGFALAPIEQAETLRDRLHLVGYALFVPVFLFTVGLDADVVSLVSETPTNAVALIMIVAAISGKVVGGYAAGTVIGLDRRQSLALGLGSSVKLTVPITATYAALKAGIIGQDLFTAVVVVSVVTSLFIPPLLELSLRRVQDESADPPAEEE
jgi:Kef-type K+ transport system membrane component KefB